MVLKKEKQKKAREITAPQSEVRAWKYISTILGFAVIIFFAYSIFQSNQLQSCQNEKTNVPQDNAFDEVNKNYSVNCWRDGSPSYQAVCDFYSLGESKSWQGRCFSNMTLQDCKKFYEKEFAPELQPTTTTWGKPVQKETQKTLIPIDENINEICKYSHPSCGSQGTSIIVPEEIERTCLKFKWHCWGDINSGGCGAVDCLCWLDQNCSGAN